MKEAAIYIISNQSNSVLYIGVTRNLIQRVFQHKAKMVSGFTQKYNVSKLVYFEQFDEIQEAIRREKVLKKWNRLWKERLITQYNPGWLDLYPMIV